MSDQNKSPEAIHAEIEDTRAHLGEDIEELKSRIRPSALSETIKERAQEGVRKTGSQLLSKAVENPTLLMLIGAGLLAAGFAVSYLALRKQEEAKYQARGALPATRGRYEQAERPARLPEPYGQEADEKYFRQHFEANFARSGRSFARYVPAYQLGASLAREQHDHGVPWEQIEADARTRWQSQRAERWDDYRDAIRYGYERSRMHELEVTPRNHAAIP